MQNKQVKFILAAALQVIIILVIIVFKISILSGGTQVLLKIAPVDPRDLLRGDYVTFRYEISNFDSYRIVEGYPRNGDTVYVTLAEVGKYWTIQSVSTRKPPTDNSVYIKGVVESGGMEGGDIFSYRNSGSRLHIIYGTEEYFIPEGEGRNFSFWNKDAGALLAVDENGNAVLKQIYINDQPWP